MTPQENEDYANWMDEQESDEAMMYQSDKQDYEDWLTKALRM